MKKYTSRIEIRVTPKFSKIIDKAADEAGLLRSELIRQFITTGIRELGILKGIKEFKQL